MTSSLDGRKSWVEKDAVKKGVLWVYPAVTGCHAAVLGPRAHFVDFIEYYSDCLFAKDSRGGGEKITHSETICSGLEYSRWLDLPLDLPTCNLVRREKCINYPHYPGSAVLGVSRYRIPRSQVKGNSERGKIF